VHWTPRHMKVVGNEIADKEAKDAVKGNERNSPVHLLLKYLRGLRLQRSASALMALQKTKSRDLWKKLWEKSPRYACTHTIDPSMPSEKYIKLINSLLKCTSSIYIQLCTHHILINHHLH
ncbi:hypothetical protein BDR06DRAFT_876801, partial [Suillus hirtellus]